MKNDHLRMLTWWIRWEDLNWPNGDNLDGIKRKAEQMAAANATAAVIFGTHFRWDYLPYFTLLHDYIATVAEELHKNGVALYDHHSVNLVHRYDTREEMRHVMLHSGPHLPFSPSREAAATWEYRGKRLNDWRMIDVSTREPLYYPQYAAEGFCYRNPAFKEAYYDYAKRLVADTGIDGLIADDPVHYMHYNSCACPACRAALAARAGIDLPPVTDRTFWGNWTSPAWRAWCDLRLESTGEFFTGLAAVLPPDFELMSCGGDSASPTAVAMASDGRKFLEGCTRVNVEMCGNTPPYPKDRETWNTPIASRYVTSSLHQAAARDAGARCYGTGYAFVEATADILWAVNKAMDSDCWLNVLKARLGLPDHILKTLPDEAQIAGRAFTFEKEHPQLFAGKQVGQAAVYYSYETRDHSLYGNLYRGYYADYRRTLMALLSAGVSAHTVTRIPENAREYPVLILSGVLVMTPEEQAVLDAYLQAGGKVLACGPCALADCKNDYHLPNAVDAAQPLFLTAPDGVHVKFPAWMSAGVEEAPDTGAFREVREGLFYRSGRMTEQSVQEELLALVRRFIAPLPVTVTASEGYFITTFRHGGDVTVQLLAGEYETDIDHHLDEIRFHRSRVNYINSVKPIGVSRTVSVRAAVAPQVFLPFHEEKAAVAAGADGTYTVTLPADCAYILLYFAGVTPPDGAV